jgi:glycosyltransferase involved in cell wall biosynthesis
MEILTDVADVRPHLSEAHVLAVPLEAGGGSRLKILEAFAAGLPVVSTPIGAEGIEAKDGTHLLLAGRSEISKAIVRVIRNPALAGTLAANARVVAEQQYDWGHIGERAASIVESIVGNTLAPAMSDVACVTSGA